MCICNQFYELFAFSLSVALPFSCEHFSCCGNVWIVFLCVLQVFRVFLALFLWVFCGISYKFSLSFAVKTGKRGNNIDKKQKACISWPKFPLWWFLHGSLRSFLWFYYFMLLVPFMLLCAMQEWTLYLWDKEFVHGIFIETFYFFLVGSGAALRIFKNKFISLYLHLIGLLVGVYFLIYLTVNSDFVSSNNTLCCTKVFTFKWWHYLFPLWLLIFLI